MEVETEQVMNVVVCCCLVLVLQKCETVIELVAGLCCDEEVWIQHNQENERCRLCNRPKHDHCDLEKGMDLCLECDWQVVQLLQWMSLKQMLMLVQWNSLEEQC